MKHVIFYISTWVGISSINTFTLKVIKYILNYGWNAVAPKLLTVLKNYYTYIKVFE